jgi:hypothetical protein
MKVTAWIDIRSWMNFPSAIRGQMHSQEMTQETLVSTPATCEGRTKTKVYFPCNNHRRLVIFGE